MVLGFSRSPCKFNTNSTGLISVIFILLIMNKAWAEVRTRLLLMRVPVTDDVRPKESLRWIMPMKQ